MRKVVMTLAFNRPHQVYKAVEKFRNTNEDWRDYEHVIVDCHYPLADKIENTVMLAQMAKKLNCSFVRPYKNRGVADNWMWVSYELNLIPGDVLIGMDPDSDPVQKNWARAICEVLETDETIGYVGLRRVSPPDSEMTHEVDESNREFHLSNIAGHDVRFYKGLVAWPMGGFSVKFMKHVGLFQSTNDYGYIEHETDKAMREHGYSWCILSGFHDQTSDRGEPEYKLWKFEQAKFKTSLPFDRWLKDRGMI